MKKLIFAMVLALILVCAAAVAEETFTSGDYKYILLEDGTAKLTKYTGEEEILEIPSEIDGYQLSTIDGDAFDVKDYLKEISIPDSVTIVNGNPFDSCARLKSIKISPDHPVLANIDGVIFDKTAKSLICYPCALRAESYEIPQGILTIGAEAFSGCDGLKWVTIPDGVTGIGAWAFGNCDDLIKIDIPDSVTDIGDNAFVGCKKLAVITLPANLESIGGTAFKACDALKKIAIPDSVTNIGVNPFERCKKLTHISVSPNHPVLATIDGVLFDKTEKKLICYPYAYDAESYAIPQGIRIIGDRAFYDCYSLKKVAIPDSVTTIGDASFYNCSSLTELTIPDSVTSIDIYAFCGCESLREVVIPDGVTSIGVATFAMCTALESLTIPSSVAFIDAEAFGNNFFSLPASLVLTVDRDSYAAQYAEENGFEYTYPDSNDWLLS